MRRNPQKPAALAAGVGEDALPAGMDRTGGSAITRCMDARLDETHRTDRAVFWRGARDALALTAWVLGFSLLGVGSLARDAGFPAGAAVLSTMLMWAGPAQAVLFVGVA